MGNYEQLKQSVSDVIKTNGNKEITGSILQNVLLTIISTVGANATFAGIATPTTNPGTPDGSVFYLASESGTYTNFGGVELQDGISVLTWNGSWSSQQIFGIDDVPTAGSKNLVESGGVFFQNDSLSNEIFTFHSVQSLTAEKYRLTINKSFKAGQTVKIMLLGSITNNDGLAFVSYDINGVGYWPSFGRIRMNSGVGTCEWTVDRDGYILEMGFNRKDTYTYDTYQIYISVMDNKIEDKLNGLCSVFDIKREVKACGYNPNVDNHFLFDLGTTFKSGQIVTIKVKTSPKVNTTIQANALDEEDNPFYPAAIHVTNGYGERSYEMEVDGRLWYYGYPSASAIGTPYVALFEISVYTKSEEEKRIEAKVNSIDTRITGLEDNALRVLTKTISYTYSQSSTIFNLNTRVNADEFVVVKAKSATGLVPTNNIAGNVKNLSDEYIDFPQIHFLNGVGYLRYTNAVDCILDAFGWSTEGYGQTGEITMTYEISVYKKNNFIFDNNVDLLDKRIITDNNNPLKIIKETPGLTAIFRNWGFIGDSLASGEMECFSGSERVWIDMREYSWGQHLARLCGAEGQNFSYGGATTRSWLTNPDWGWPVASQNPKQAYIIALGVNDAVSIPLGSPSSIDLNDYNNNLDDFYGNYAGIIQRIKSIQPKAKIFVVTMPERSYNFNTPIKYMAEIFDNVYVLDLEKYATDYLVWAFQQIYWMNGHMSPSGYLYVAYTFMTYIDWLIRHNGAEFIDTALIGTNYTPTSV